MVDVCAPVHGVAEVADHGAGWDEDGGLPVGPASDEEGGVAEGGAVVDWDDGVEAQCYGEGSACQLYLWGCLDLETPIR